MKAGGELEGDSGTRKQAIAYVWFSSCPRLTHPLLCVISVLVVKWPASYPTALVVSIKHVL